MSGAMDAPPDPWSSQLAVLTETMRHLDPEHSTTALADLIDHLDRVHEPDTAGNCSACTARSDVSWPCSEWLDLMGVCAEWLSHRVGGA